MRRSEHLNMRSLPSFRDDTADSLMKRDAEQIPVIETSAASSP
jgi:hypothetical protein